MCTNFFRASEAPSEDGYKTVIFQYVSTDEKEQHEDLPILLEAKDPVLIWSFDDDLKPKVCSQQLYMRVVKL